MTEKVHGLKGIPKTDEHRRKIREHRKGLTFGEKNGSAKLTEKQVQEIMVRLSNGETQLAIATDYRVSRSAIRNIKLGKAWTHITGGDE